jgi:hypothetical protein
MEFEKTFKKRAKKLVGIKKGFIFAPAKNGNVYSKRESSFK